VFNKISVVRVFSQVRKSHNFVDEKKEDDNETQENEPRTNEE
jgi:hypothetical protein